MLVRSEPVRHRSCETYDWQLLEHPIAALQVKRRHCKTFLGVDAELQPEPVGVNPARRIRLEERGRVLVEPKPALLLLGLRRHRDGTRAALRIEHDLEVAAGLLISGVGEFEDGQAQVPLDYLGLLGLQGGEPEPFEVLARTWGTRTTDRIQVLPIPRVGPGGHLQTRFLVHGGGHVDPDGHALRRVHVGDRLQLRHEPQNPEDENAVLVLRMGEEERLGYIPRPLAPFIHALWRAHVEPVVIAEHINLPGARLVSNRMRLLARLEVQVPAGFDVEAALGLVVAQ